MTLGPRGRLATGFLGVYLLLSTAAGVYLAEGVVRPSRRRVSEADRQAAVLLAAARASRLEDASLVARDGAYLRAWLFTPTEGNGRSVIVLHGQSSNRAGMLPYIDLMLSAGFRVLAPDARAQGNSDGSIATYGVVESDDVHDWVKRLQQRNGGGCVYGFAESMGAGTLLQALGQSQMFCRVVVESPFASFREVAYDRIGSAFHAGPWLARTALRPVVEAGLIYVRARYGVDVGAADPLAALKGSAVPVLLIHGTADTSIPVRHSRLLAAARRAGTSLWEVPGAGHCAAMGVAPAEFARRLLTSYGVVVPGAEAARPQVTHSGRPPPDACGIGRTGVGSHRYAAER